jgi:hypothetical protein
LQDKLGKKCNDTEKTSRRIALREKVRLEYVNRGGKRGVRLLPGGLD